MLNNFLVMAVVFLSIFFTSSPGYAYADPAGKNLAVFIFGSSGSTEFKQYFNDARTDLGRVLEANGFSKDRQVVFRETPAASKNGMAEYQSEDVALEKQLAAIAQGGPYDDLFFFLAGHASGHDEQAMLQLPGRDISYLQLLGRVDKIQFKRLLMVLVAPQAQVWVQRFSGPGRIVIAGSQKREFDFIPSRFLINFPQMFEKAARWHAKQPGEKKQGVSLAEVFLLTSLRVRGWYEDNHLLATEEPVLDTDGDGSASVLGTPGWLKEAPAADQIRFTIPWIRGGIHDSGGKFRKNQSSTN